MAAEHQEETKEIDLLQILKVLLDKALFIILITVLAGAVAFCVSFFLITPKYRAQVTLYVNNRASSEGATTQVTTSDLSASSKLVDTYAAIIESNTVLDRVLTDTGVNMLTANLKKSISVASVNNTEVFTVSVTNESPETAAKLANSIGEVAVEELPNIITGSSVKVIDQAKAPTSKFSPSYKKNTLIGALIGFVVSAAFFIIRSLLDRTVKSTEDLKEFGLPILAEIPDMAQAEKNAQKTNGYGYGYAKAAQPARTEVNHEEKQ